MKPDHSTGADSLSKAVRRNLSSERIKLLYERGRTTLRERGAQALWREVAFRFNLATRGQTWWYRADVPLRREILAQRESQPKDGPLVSVLVPLYNTPSVFLKQMVRSVLAQSYERFELVLADGSDEAHAYVGEVAQRFAKRDDRVRYIKLAQNKGISGNTNAAIEQSCGGWIVLLDHDDVLQPNALYEVVRHAGEAELIYSDEIVLDSRLKKLWKYHFKGGYGPDTLRGCNYITHLCAFSRELLQRSGAQVYAEFDGAQDYDLILRLTEQAKAVKHIPKVLYFWRRHEQSTTVGIEQKPKAEQAGRLALQSHIDRIGLKGVAQGRPGHPGTYHIRYDIEKKPLVSVIIPSSDHIDELECCLNSIYEKSGWDELEVMVVDNNSKDAATPLYYKQARQMYPGLRIVKYEGAFNYSAINNFAAKLAKGEHLLLLNNDIELLSEGFVREMLSYSQREDVGAVGAMLYYPDDTVQHAGLILGIGGTAGVSHKGHKRGDGGDMYRLATVQNVSAVTGAALMVKAALYEKLGGLDEQAFGVAFNDVDFCLRLRRAGYLNVFTPFAQAYHYESKSRGYDTEGEKKVRFDREAAAFKQRWAEELSRGDEYYNPHFTLKTENFGYR